VPILSAANWAARGCTRAAISRAGAPPAQAEMAGGARRHALLAFLFELRRDLQRRFFGHFLKGEKHRLGAAAEGVAQHPPPGEQFTLRAENEWPLARTQWTKFYLDPANRGLGTEQPKGAATLSYQTSSDGLTFLMPPMTADLEITGPVAAKLFVSSDTRDADLFLVLAGVRSAGKEVVFIGSNDPRTPVGLGWLRASHRKLDPQRTLPYRPWHTHDQEQRLTPGVPVELDIEIWPTCIVVPPGYRVGLTVRGKDYEYDGTDAALPHATYAMRGVGPFTHTDPRDRPPAIFGGVNHAAFRRTASAESAASCYSIEVRE